MQIVVQPAPLVASIVERLQLHIFEALPSR